MLVDKISVGLKKASRKLGMILQTVSLSTAAAFNSSAAVMSRLPCSKSDVK